MKTWESDLEIGDTVQTGDGMLHRVEDVALVVWIKPIAPTDAPILGIAPETVTKWDPSS